jgi:hypothetical protein
MNLIAKQPHRAGQTITLESLKAEYAGKKSFKVAIYKYGAGRQVEVRKLSNGYHGTSWKIYETFDIQD